MKFKITPKDFLIFCLYCILLLYLCAIAVLNFSSFLNEGEFYGLLPFKAFTGDYIVLTLFMFFISLVMGKKLNLVMLDGVQKKKLRVMQEWLKLILKQKLLVQQVFL